MAGNKLPTIDIKGKKYIMVKDRILAFHELYPDGYFITDLISDPQSDLIIIKATVYPDAKSNRCFTGYSQAVMGGSGVNATAALENAETSAVGRCLGMLGIGIIESVASADEVNKALTSPKRETKYASVAQIKWMRGVASEVTGLEEGSEIDEWIEELTGSKPNLIPGWKTAETVKLIQGEATKSDNIAEANKIDTVYNPDDKEALDNIDLSKVDF